MDDAGGGGAAARYLRRGVIGVALPLLTLLLVEAERCVVPECRLVRPRDVQVGDPRKALPQAPRHGLHRSDALEARARHIPYDCLALAVPDFGCRRNRHLVHGLVAPRRRPPLQNLAALHGVPAPQAAAHDVPFVELRSERVLRHVPHRVLLHGDTAAEARILAAATGAATRRKAARTRSIFRSTAGSRREQHPRVVPPPRPLVCLSVMWERRVTVRREGTELGQHEIGAEERLGIRVLVSPAGSPGDRDMRSRRPHRGRYECRVPRGATSPFSRCQKEGVRRPQAPI